MNPHFLFNSITSLAGLIEADQKMVGDFLQRKSDMYRYILKSGEQETVALYGELHFIQLYIDTQKTRFESGLVVEMNVPEANLNFRKKLQKALLFTILTAPFYKVYSPACYPRKVGNHLTRLVHNLREPPEACAF